MKSTQTARFELTSPAFDNGKAIPRDYTADGANVSPPLMWADPPEGTKALLLVCDDPDAPAGTWVHWVLYDIPPERRSLPRVVPSDRYVQGIGTHGRNSFKGLGYGGPAPPPGKPHRYFFRLYAVDARTGLAPGATRDDVQAALKGHVIGRAVLVGTYGRGR